jgi:hypothetical protein
MLNNPYPIPTDEDDKASCRFATYLSKEDKTLLMSLRPVRGTPQAVVNNLIKNFCDELRALKLDFYHPDADDILTVLVGHRKLTADQINRLRCTTFGVSSQIPTWLQHSGGGSKIRQRHSNDATKPSDVPRTTKRGINRHSGETSSAPTSKGGTQKTTVG